MTDSISSAMQKDSIFKVGEVVSVNGREVRIKVEKAKNLSHLLYCGELIKNVVVGSYVKILKGFEQFVAKVEGEYIQESKIINQDYYNTSEIIDRILVVQLIGYIEEEKYFKGVKELPLVGNDCMLMDNHEFALIHRFATTNDPTIDIGNLMSDERIPIELGINKLFSSHIGIFGNTGSGKSYTLANIYRQLFLKMEENTKFKNNAKFLLFDFNGEYSSEETIVNNKKIYNLSTRGTTASLIPLRKKDLLNPELVNILTSATEKTQQPFIKRSLHLYESVHNKDNPKLYLQGVVSNLVYSILQMSDLKTAKLLLDYIEQILPPNNDENGINIGYQKDFQWHAVKSTFYFDSHYFNEGSAESIKTLTIYKTAKTIEEPQDFIESYIMYMYIQLINDVLNNRASNDHIAPAIHKLKALQKDFSKVFIVDDTLDLWDEKNFVVINLNNVNIMIRKLIPLLVSFKLYHEQKDNHDKDNSKYLNIIVDEAHNILSYESQRESESWKDFRLETFEEIIKEGRKFGVFMTIASQRPSDISATIISQLHNYFIHRLINNRDLEMVEKAIAYLDKVSVESLPILPIGACVLSGIIADLPIIIQVNKMPKCNSPVSETMNLIDSWIDKDEDII